MASRMEKYYDNTCASSKRSTKNETLYKKMYEEETYSNIEGVVETPRNNEINIEKIREIILRREQEEKEKTQLVKREFEIERPNLTILDDEEKNYDIMDILKQAKQENKDSRENKYRSLDEEYLEDLKNPVRKVEKIPVEEEYKEIKELLNTLTNSKELKKLKDAELSLDMFSDLKANTDTLSDEDTIIKALIDEAKQIEERNNKEKDEIDNTFDTANMKLKAKDYVEKIEDLDKDDSKNPLLTFFMVLLFLGLAALVIFILYTMLK